MSETSTKNMSKAKARQMKRSKKRTDQDIVRQVIRKLRRIKKSSGEQAVQDWIRENVNLTSIMVGKGHGTMRRITVNKAAIRKAVGVA